MDTLPQEIIHIIAYYVTSVKLMNKRAPYIFQNAVKYRLINGAFCDAINDIYKFNEIKYSLQKRDKLDEKFASAEFKETVRIIRELTITQRLHYFINSYNESYGGNGCIFSYLKHNRSTVISYNNIINIHFRIQSVIYTQDKKIIGGFYIPARTYELKDVFKLSACDKFYKLNDDVIEMLCKLINNTCDDNIFTVYVECRIDANNIINMYITH